MAKPAEGARCSCPPGAGTPSRSPPAFPSQLTAEPWRLRGFPAWPRWSRPGLQEAALRGAGVSLCGWCSLPSAGACSLCWSIWTWSQWSHWKRGSLRLELGEQWDRSPRFHKHHVFGLNLAALSYIICDMFGENLGILGGLLSCELASAGRGLLGFRGVSLLPSLTLTALSRRACSSRCGLILSSLFSCIVFFNWF